MDLYESVFSEGKARTGEDHNSKETPQARPSSPRGDVEDRKLKTKNQQVINAHGPNGTDIEWQKLKMAYPAKLADSLLPYFVLHPEEHGTFSMQ